jgi:flagellar hook protein FlgE
MLRAMYSGISGMRGFQTKLDVIGNNIANVNTVGFKKSRVMFQDILSQTMAGGSAPTPTTGGTNAKQVGLGSSLATIDVVHTQGGLMPTGAPSDLAVQGNGFFVVVPEGPQEGGGFAEGSLTNKKYFLTRAGNFIVDAAGNLVTGNGMFVVGIQGTPNDQGVVDGGVLKPINLYDVAGGSPTANKIKSFSIGPNGEITVQLSTLSGEDVTDNPNQTKTFVGLATVENPGSLEKSGSNLYTVPLSANGSGTTIVLDENQEANGVIMGIPKTKERGSLYAGQLEMSNTDLAEEFAEMIVAQRGFQANSRIITTSDSILEELVNLKR